jgi:hypothetical protein
MRYRRRLCLAVDLRKYSQHSYAEQANAQARMVQVLAHALSRARVPRVMIQRQAQGDGQLVIMPSGTDDVRSIPALILGLRDGLFRTNCVPGQFGRLRMRAALCQGSVSRAPNGYVGDCVVLATRLMDSEQVREALENKTESDLALAVPPDLYQDVITQEAYALPSGEFDIMELTKKEKEFTATAWLYVPKSAPSWDVSARPVRWGYSPGRTATEDYILPALTAVHIAALVGHLAAGLPHALDWRLSHDNQERHAVETRHQHDDHLSDNHDDGDPRAHPPDHVAPHHWFGPGHTTHHVGSGEPDHYPHDGGHDQASDHHDPGGHFA